MTDDWQNAFRRGLEDLVGDALVAGATQIDVFNLAIKEIERLRVANERDPDPADDGPEQTFDEPANDWPGAD
ncbi:MAG: hypothetical protein QE284_13060 [Rhizobium sp.]|nr:hypothetical protein [Rhizobium sp.]